MLQFIILVNVYDPFNTKERIRVKKGLPIFTAEITESTEDWNTNRTSSTKTAFSVILMFVLK
jgi:hypothetical protein